MNKEEILEKYKGVLLGEISYALPNKPDESNNLYVANFLNEKESQERFFELMYYETTLTDEGKKFSLEYFGFDKIPEMAYEASKKHASVKYDRQNIEKQLKTFLY